MAMQDRVEEAVRHGQRVIRQNKTRTAQLEYDVLNEATTRYAIIDPILRALGWKLDDPSHCQVEQWQERAGKEYSGRSDYLLIKDGSPVVVIEAERLSKGMNGWTEENQLRGYSSSSESELAVLTNGLAWYFYPLNEVGAMFGYKRLPDVDLYNLNPDENARELKRALSRRRRSYADWRPLPERIIE